MAYVGCIAGAILIEDYKRQVIDAGFSNVEIVDSVSDLNAYAKIENQSGCCSPAPTQIETTSSCCAPATVSQIPGTSDTKLYEQFADLLSRYNVNDYAASVKVYAIK